MIDRNSAKTEKIWSLRISQQLMFFRPKNGQLLVHTRDKLQSVVGCEVDNRGENIKTQKTCVLSLLKTHDGINDAERGYKENIEKIAFVLSDHDVHCIQLSFVTKSHWGNINFNCQEIICELLSANVPIPHLCIILAMIWYTPLRNISLGRSLALVNFYTEIFIVITVYWCSVSVDKGSETFAISTQGIHYWISSCSLNDDTRS